MSPEQARGQPVDKRTDIWAFGCVLFELLTGAKAFGGDATDATVSDVLASVLAREPSWKQLPPNISWRIRELLERCLWKDARNRLHDIADARLDLQNIQNQIDRSLDILPNGTEVKRPDYRLISVILVLVVLIPLSFWAGRFINLGKKVGNSGDYPWALTVDLSDSSPLALDGQISFGIDTPLIDISPDGRTLVYVGGETEGETKLYLRDLSTLEVRSIEKTEGAIHPFFSPDG